MTIKLTITFILTITSCLVNGQNSMRLAQPNLPSPVQEFDSIFEKQKLDNPIFLNGAVKEVRKNVSYYNLPNEKEQKKSYYYTLNKEKKVTHYSSNLEFDEMNTEWLNMEKSTILNQDKRMTIGEFTYTIKNHKVIARESQQEEFQDLIIYTDSISYIYTGERVNQIEYYKRDIVEDIVEENDSYIIGFSDYYLSGYEKAWFDAKGQMNFKQEIFAVEESILISEFQYQYNNSGEFECYAQTNAEFDLNNFNLEKHRANPTKKIIEETDTLHLAKNQTSGGVFEYDDIGRCILYSFNSKNKKDFTIKIEYTKDKTIIENYYDGNLSTTQEIQFDANSNPIKADYFDVTENKKSLSKSIALEITYFK